MRARFPRSRPRRGRGRRRGGGGGRAVRGGGGEGAGARARSSVAAEAGTLVTARVGEAQLSFTVAQPGQHMVSNALAVLAAVEAAGGDPGLAGRARGARG